MSAPSKKAANDETQPYIFLDLDGVLADFDLHAIEQGKRTADGKLKWDEMDYHWWATMPAFAGAKEFYDATKKLGNVRFLSAPSLDTGAFTGKADWVQKFVPERGKFILKDLILCSAGDKHCLAQPTRILIDDREKNIQEWIAAGGIGIHHKGDFKETMKTLELVVEKLAITGRTPAASKLTAPALKKAKHAPGT